MGVKKKFHAIKKHCVVLLTVIGVLDVLKCVMIKIKQKI